MSLFEKVTCAIVVLVVYFECMYLYTSLCGRKLSIPTINLLSFCTVTSALRCYQCNSEYDPRCGDPFDEYSLGQVNCSLKEPLEHLPGSEPVLCRKTRQKSTNSLNSYTHEIQRVIYCSNYFFFSFSFRQSSHCTWLRICAKWPRRSSMFPPNWHLWSWKHFLLLH